MEAPKPEQPVVTRTPVFYSDSPTVSCVVVSRGNRIKFLEITKRCMLAQDYNNIIEWVFVNGSQNKAEAATFDTYINDVLKKEIKNLVTAPWIGRKLIGAYRNECNRIARGEIIVNFDDDDYYFPVRTSHTVAVMKKESSNVAGCNDHYIYDFDMKLLCNSPKTLISYLATNNTMAYSREFSKTHAYDETKSHAEEPSFIANEYVCQLIPKYVTVQFSHFSNTYNKRALMLQALMKAEGVAQQASTELVRRELQELIKDKQFIKDMCAVSMPPISPTPIYDIVYYAGDFQPEWRADSKSLGGSEQAIVHLSESWAKLGFKVAVYANLDKACSINGVDYFKNSQFPYSQRQKVLILWRISGLIILPLRPQADVIIADFHDNFNPIMKFVKSYADDIHYFVFKSEYHVKCFESIVCKLEDEKRIVLPNGVRVSDFQRKEGDPERDPFRVVYASSYERGLVWMVKGLWPIIQQMEPRAELHVYYGIRDLHPELRNVLLEAVATMHIMDHGLQPLDIIRREKLRAGFHLYPSHHGAEIDCISVRESLVAGCIPILAKTGVFLERDGFFIDFNIQDPATLTKPAIEIVKLMRDTARMDTLREELYKSKTIFSWETVADKWLTFMGLSSSTIKTPVTAEATNTIYMNEEQIISLEGQRTTSGSGANTNNCYTMDIAGKQFDYYILEDCQISKSIKENAVWEPHLHAVFEKFVNKDSVVIECGCHIGTHTLLLASLSRKLYGFEPMPKTYEVLCKNIAINKIDNAILYKKGVANKEGKTKYSWIPNNNPGGSGLDNNPMGVPCGIACTNEHIEVELTTIDSLQLDKLDFMKIDVEGYEPLVIEGGMHTIQRCKPTIVMEIWKDHHCAVDVNYPKELFKNLLDIGYTVEHISGPDFLFTHPLSTRE